MFSALAALAGALKTYWDLKYGLVNRKMPASPTARLDRALLVRGPVWCQPI